jgi:arylsulfatase A-like enzyme
MYDPADVEPGSLTPGELKAMAPWFGLTQEQNPDFSEWQETAFANHGFGSHLVEEKLLRQNIAIYYGMISFLDAQFGRILAALDRLGVADDTIVVFTSDHGHFLGQHGLTAKGPFHYEDLLRVPFLVRWPGRIAPGSVTDGLLGLIDLSPTLLSACGLPVPGAMQGVDQTPVWTGQVAAAQDHVIVENRHQPSAVHLRTLIEDRYKMTLYGGRPWGDLFDLQEDPGEVHNRFADPDYRGVRDELALRFLDAEIRREPTRYPRIASA